MILVKVSSGGTGIQNIISRPQQRIERDIYAFHALVFEGGGDFREMNGQVAYGPKPVWYGHAQDREGRYNCRCRWVRDY